MPQSLPLSSLLTPDSDPLYPYSPIPQYLYTLYLLFPIFTLMLIFRKNLPRWIILLIDLVICFFSLIIAYLLRFNFASIPQVEIDTFPVVFPFMLGGRLLSFLISRTYAGIVRYTGSRDAARIFIVNFIVTCAFILSNLVKYYLYNGTFIIPFSIVIIEFMSTTFLMISLRVIFKTLYFEYVNPSREKRNVIIFGAGEAGIITKRTLDRDAGTKYNVLAFIDDDVKRQGSKLEGVTICNQEKLKELLRENDVAHVIISVQHLPPSRKQQLVELCLEYDTKVLTVPPVSSWINGELSFKQIKKINIEELLERDPIKLDEENISRQVKGKNVLVTGAAGSIGSEIVRQLLRYKPSRIILLDHAESPLYEMEMELNEKTGRDTYEIVIGDVRNRDRMRNLFRTFKPHIIF